jgi:hypothetical protein
VPPEEVFLPRLVDAVVRGEADGFHAIRISCCSDPGLQACRAALAVPVSAPFEAVSKLLPAPGRLAILCMRVPPAAGESELRGEEWIPQLLDSYSCAATAGPLLPVQVERPAMEFGTPGATPDAVGDALIASMRAAIDGPGVGRAGEAAEAGAAAVFPTCTYWSGMLDHVRKQVDIAVLDPIEELSRYLESVAGAVTRRERRHTSATATSRSAR